MNFISTFDELNRLYESAPKVVSKKVTDLLKAGNTSINKFAFYIMGEGIEKKSEDLSEEVAKQVAAAQK
jgi:elongation factor Ts